MDLSKFSLKDLLDEIKRREKNEIKKIMDSSLTNIEKIKWLVDNGELTHNDKVSEFFTKNKFYTEYKKIVGDENCRKIKDTVITCNTLQHDNFYWFDIVDEIRNCIIDGAEFDDDDLEDINEFNENTEKVVNNSEFVLYECDGFDVFSVNFGDFAHELLQWMLINKESGFTYDW